MAGVMRLHLLVSAQLEAVTASHGIPLADYLVLGVVRRAPRGRTSPSQICEILHRTSGGMSLALDRLERAGWLVRAPDETDGRKVTITLTPAGRALAVRVNRALHDWEQSLGLGRRREAELHAVVDEVIAALEPAADDVAAAS